MTSGTSPANLYTFSGDEFEGVRLESNLRSICVIPGTTEYGYGTTVVTRTEGAETIYENAIAGGDVTDFSRSLDQMLRALPNLGNVNLIVAWHGTDLDISKCEIKPKVEDTTKVTAPYGWNVGGLTRASAEQVSYYGESPAVGGAPSDRSVYEAIQAIKARGLTVTLYPFILMDIPAGNGLPDPYGASEQPAYPWRGRITCSPAPGRPGTVDQTAAAATQVAAFFGSAAPGDFGWDATDLHVTYSGPAEWSFRRHILHLARLGAAAGADHFLIGSEMVSMTSIRSGATTFPAVSALVALAADCRTILGADVEIGYAADWSEYHSYRPGGGEILFHLDPLWSDSNIDFIGIDNYLPMADWRVESGHLDEAAGWSTTYDIDYLRANIEGGENYDWFYADDAARDAQTRTEITDPVHGEPWVWRNKDIRNWWLSQHHDRPGGTRSGTPTAWTPQEKPIVFTEFGCPAVNRGANQPNVFPDTKSSEGGYPRYSLGYRDDHMQRVCNEALLSYWSENNPASGFYAGLMLTMARASAWCWDARPFPDFPDREDVWTDALNWEHGHWLNGRVEEPKDDFGTAAVYRYTDAGRDVVHGGFTYLAAPGVEASDITVDGALDRQAHNITIARDAPLASLFKSYRPAHPVWVTVQQIDLAAAAPTAAPRWKGRIVGTRRRGNQLILTGQSNFEIRTVGGLRRHYQFGCSHRLYHGLCGAKKSASEVSAAVVAADGTSVTLAPGWAGSFDAAKFVGGYVEWTTPAGAKERRGILGVTDDTFRLSGPVRGLSPGDTAFAYLGCARDIPSCRDLHGVLPSYGGFPTIPVTANPLDPGTNNWY